MTFGEELVKSAHEALDIAKGRAKPADIYIPESIDVAAIRKRQKLSQDSFAKKYGLSLGTVKDWEQKRRSPDRAARILLSVIDKEPEAVTKALKLNHLEVA